MVTFPVLDIRELKCQGTAGRACEIIEHHNMRAIAQSAVAADKHRSETASVISVRIPVVPGR